MEKRWAVWLYVIGGFSALRCFSSACSAACARISTNDTRLTCNATTMVCLHGCIQNYEGDKCDRCVRGKTGPQCNTNCDYNCQNCTWENGNVGCAVCRLEYYYYIRRCVQCKTTCRRNNTISELPTCNPTSGTCTFGCIDGWYGDQCYGQCSPLCINRTCDRNSSCCTSGCKYDTYGGCHCTAPCNRNCQGGTCYPNLTCSQGCELNKWGPDCDQTCNENCAETAENTPTCGRDGTCAFGCRKTFMGPKCSESCPANCIENDCNAMNGHCLQGCKNNYWKEKCDTKCSLHCPQSDEFTCIQDTGTCILNCGKGQFGALCDQDCPPNCLNGTCDRYNATCVLGCMDGLTGENCSVGITVFFSPAYNSQYGILLSAGISGGCVLIAVITWVIICLYTRNKFARTGSSARNGIQTCSKSQEATNEKSFTDKDQSSSTHCKQEIREGPDMHEYDLPTNSYENLYQDIQRSKDADEHCYEGTIQIHADNMILYQGLEARVDNNEHLYESAGMT